MILDTYLSPIRTNLPVIPHLPTSDSSLEFSSEQKHIRKIDLFSTYLRYNSFLLFMTLIIHIFIFNSIYKKIIY